MTKFTYIPNFDRIHSFLEEKLGTSDVSMRFFDLNSGTLRLWSNEPRRGFTKLESGHYLEMQESELTPTDSHRLTQVSEHGPTYFFMEKNDPAIFSTLRAERSCAYAYSIPFSKRFGFHDDVTFEAGHDYDALLCHEGAHAAVDRSLALALPHVPSFFRGMFDEAIASDTSLKYIMRYDPKSAEAFLKHMEKMQYADGDVAVYQHAYPLVKSQNPTLMRRINEVLEGNKKLAVTR